jgi:hypothetical protein
MQYFVTGNTMISSAMKVPQLQLTYNACKNILKSMDHHISPNQIFYAADDMVPHMSHVININSNSFRTAIHCWKTYTGMPL